MYDYLNDNKVAVYFNEKLKSYPQKGPYNPSQVYPEYQLDKGQISKDNNEVYDAVRNLLNTLKMDNENFDKVNWNPFKEIIKPGEKVVIKPNFVLDKHSRGGEIDAVLTHPSIIRAVVDYVYIALKGQGEIIIGDAPQADADWDNLLNVTELETIKKLYKGEKGFNINILDYRQLKFVYINKMLTKDSRITLDGDPSGYTDFNLGNLSEFDKIESFEKLYGADYDRNETRKHHNKGIHEYCISNTILTADVVISLAKMKTHRKGGVTLNLKNLVGINGNKNYLPHFRIGTPEDGGDEYMQLNKQQKTALYSQRFFIDKFLAKPNYIKDTLYKLALKSYKLLEPIFFRKVDSKQIEGGGSWYGNDTVWRMVVDLNKILIYGDTQGNLFDKPQRKFFNIVDGIMAGEGEGPLVPDTKICGILAGGVNFLLVDLVLIRIMGFDFNKIPIYANSLFLKNYKLTNVKQEETKVCSNINIIEDYINKKDYHFKAPSKWKGHIELLND